MTPSLIKMWISFAGIGAFALAALMVALTTRNYQVVCRTRASRGFCHFLIWHGDYDLRGRFGTDRGMKRMKRMMLMVMVVGATLLGGCMFPDTNRVDNIPYEEQLTSVQTAVDSFKESTGVLPIKTKPARRRSWNAIRLSSVDSSRVIWLTHLSIASKGAAYSNTSLVDAETEPTVKLIDLRVTERLQQLQTNINAFRAKEGKFPFKGSLGKNQFTLDYDLIFVEEEPVIPSPYFDRDLPIYVDGTGQLFVDYREDVKEALENTDMKPKTGEDIRYLLYETSLLPCVFTRIYDK